MESNREDWAVHRPAAPEAPIPGRHWYSGCSDDMPRVDPRTGRCEDCGEEACTECGREGCEDCGPRFQTFAALLLGWSHALDGRKITLEEFARESGAEEWLR